MSPGTFTSAGNTYKITVYAVPSDGKKHPMILLVHGNFGLGAPYGDQIQGFASDLADCGYLVAVPQYYQDDDLHFDDMVPHVQTLADAITAMVARADADPERLGLIGFSLGAATAMTFIASNPQGRVKVLADFYGLLNQEIRDEVSRFPPTIIFHNDDDQIVKFENSKDLDELLPNTIAHEFIPYQEQWMEFNHAFRPNGHADVDSRARTIAWFAKHLPPTGN